MAYLRVNGSTPGKARGYRHDLGRYVDEASSKGLTLREKTLEHLASMTRSREYLVSRYGPEVADDLSEINRMRATRREVLDKVRRALGGAELL